MSADFPAFEAKWQAEILPGPPLIAPARQFVFPQAVPGEEDALARGALWVRVKPASGGVFLAQCALGFAGKGVANGIWATPDPGVVLAVAGGYAYRIDTVAPEGTTLLPMRPVVAVHRSATGLVLVGFHALYLLTAGREWESPRISWEGVAISGIEGDTVSGTGWHMRSDRELPFRLDLLTREMTGGAYLP